ncbi:oxidoreductase [Pseudonocardia sp. TRM90224]|uniref:oxidoreductase n=1 Tax=Pseudonocardia sp. TRM90224 TaxID=2812678 RepID=UPI001E32144E|nr:NADH:flavin oxidoreductase [Pseudonocardia sp. TRM90224]
MSTSSHPAFSKIEFAGHVLPNRYAVAPMTRVSATPDGVPTADMAEYYAAFAEGGFGLVISEGTYTDTAHSQGYLNQPGLASPEHVDGWRHVTRRVHEAGGVMIAQLMHAGAISQGNAFGHGTVGPSAVTPLGVMMEEYGGEGPWSAPAELSTAGIDEVVAGFVAAARNALAAGFDGVELHAANGYLLDQFLTVYTNQRTDAYGGTVENRARLTAEIVTAVKELGALVGVRLSQTKVNDFEYRWPGGHREAETIFTELAAAGADYLHIASEGRNWIDTARLASGTTVTALARSATGLPVIVNGGMHDPVQAGEVLAGGHADILSIARGALGDPQLPRKLEAGETPIRFDSTMLSPSVTLANVRRWRNGS